MIYYYRGTNARKRFADFKNGIRLFEKRAFGEMKLQEAEKQRNVFKSNLNKTIRDRDKCEEQKSVLSNIKWL